jgi:membrane-associated phospholipid phosphatase
MGIMRCKKHFCIINSTLILLTIVMVNTASAQPIESISDSCSAEMAASCEQSSEVVLDTKYFKGYISDTKYILGAPVHEDKSYWLKASLVAGTAAGFYFFDQNIQEWSQKKRGSGSDQIARLVKPFGEGIYTLPALGLLYLYGYTEKDKKAEKAALLTVESLLISAVFTQTLKYSFHRLRPEDSDRYDRWDGPCLSGSNLSFPSGEATAAFSVATVLASEYEDRAWVPPLAYGMATLTALARINDNGHWASDVFVGSAIGYLTAKTIVRLHKEKSTFLILPLTDGGNHSLSISWMY